MAWSNEFIAIHSAAFVWWFSPKSAHLHALLAWLDEHVALVRVS